jgi:hypothetical protein
VTIPACESCRQIFAKHEDNKKLADILETEHAQCDCEKYAVGQGSPGAVADDETLLRIIVSPRDVDPTTGVIAARPFEKAFVNGVSVCRSIAPDEDIVALAKEGLQRRDDLDPQVLNVCKARARDIRDIRDGLRERVFCIYDQTVTRSNPGLDPIPTHAGIFGRHPPPRAPDRKKMQKDFAGMLRELFIEGERTIEQFRQGLLSGISRVDS